MRKIILIIVFIALAIISNAQQKYAVLICGDKAVETPTIVTNPSTWGTPGDSIKNEFWNDTFLMWEMLVFEKGYSDENVFVLYYDGDDYFTIGLADRYNVEEIHNEYDKITDYPANKDNVEMVFDGLATGTYPFPLVTEDDFLFVWTFGHGNIDGNPDPSPVLRLINQEYISNIEFTTHTNAINANKKVFWMQQENANNFVKTIKGKTIVSDPNPLAGKLPQEKHQAWNSLLKDVL